MARRDGEWAVIRPAKNAERRGGGVTRPVPPPDGYRLLVLVGIPGSGKTSFASFLAGMGWVVVSQDSLGSRQRCEVKARELLKQGARVIIDRCNFDASQRGHWIRIAVSVSLHEDACAAVWLDIRTEICQQRVRDRVGHQTLGGPGAVSVVARFARDLRPPCQTEGFHLVLRCRGDHELSEAVALFSGAAGGFIWNSPAPRSSGNPDSFADFGRSLSAGADCTHGASEQPASARGKGALSALPHLPPQAVSVAPWSEENGVTARCWDASAVASHQVPNKRNPLSLKGRGQAVLPSGGELRSNTQATRGPGRETYSGYHDGGREPVWGIGRQTWYDGAGNAGNNFQFAQGDASFGDGMRGWQQQRSFPPLPASVAAPMQPSPGAQSPPPPPPPLPPPPRQNPSPLTPIQVLDPQGSWGAHMLPRQQANGGSEWRPWDSHGQATTPRFAPPRGGGHEQMPAHSSQAGRTMDNSISILSGHTAAGTAPQNVDLQSSVRTALSTSSPVDDDYEAGGADCSSSWTTNQELSSSSGDGVSNSVGEQWTASGAWAGQSSDGSGRPIQFCGNSC